MIGTGLLRTIAGFVGDIGRARRAVAAYEELDGLSDPALAARGLTRGQLAAKALEAGFGGTRHGR